MGSTTIEVQVLPRPTQEHSHREKPVEKCRPADPMWRTVDEVKCFVVPRAHRRTAIDGCHRDAGHQGKKRMESLVSDRFWWPGVYEYVNRAVKNCRRCQLLGGREERAPMVPMMVTAPLQLVHLNFTSFEITTNLTESPKVKNVLVIVDHYTGYTRAYVTKDQKASTTAKILYGGFISIFGAPERILTDQGKAFTSEVVGQVCSQFGISESTTTAYHPQGNGQVEQAFQTLGRMMGKLEDEFKGQWPRHLSKLTQAYNSTQSAVTRYSSHFLMFGQWPRLPNDFIFLTHEVMGTLRPVDNYVTEFISALRKAFEVTCNMTQMEALRQKWRYDRKVSTVTLNKGDVVLVRNDQFVGKRKLKDHWGDEVYTVCDQVDVDVLVYIIENQ